MNASAVRGLRLTRDPTTLAWLGALHRQAREEIVTAIVEIAGVGAGRTLEASGLESLHTVIEAGDVGRLRDRVLGRLRESLLGLAVRVGRDVLGWSDDFYVDDYLILRINFPYEVARLAPAGTENPGIGRVSPLMREEAAARRVKDPVFDPAAYHRGHPPPAWAHGPHLDSWSGHSRDGVNIWWAIGEVPAEAGMVLYPQLAGASLSCDRRTLYLAAGQPLPPPTVVPLAAGEMLVFDPEILHGTHLNVTDRTRVAISLRLNSARPVFDPASFYAREFWRRASDIEAGDLETVLHLKREENLAPPGPPVTPPSVSDSVLDLQAGAGDTVVVGPSSLVADGGRVIANLGGRRIMILRATGRLTAVSADCPHYGIALADGGVDGRRLHCPACAVAFDLDTGLSACASLRLHRFPVRDEAGLILLGGTAAAAS